MHRDVSLSRIQGAAIPGEGADGDGGKSFEASASGNDDLVLSLCFLVREDCWRYGGFGRHCGHLLGLKGGTHCSLYAESQSEVYPESINLYRFSMKIEAPLCRYHGGESNIVGAERQSAIAPSMTRLAQDSLRMSKTKGSNCAWICYSTSEQEFTVFGLGRSCPLVPCSARMRTMFRCMVIAMTAMFTPSNGVVQCKGCMWAVVTFHLSWRQLSPLYLSPSKGRARTQAGA